MEARGFRILGAAIAVLLPACGGGGDGSGGGGGGSGNQAPSVTLLEPPDGQTFTAPATVSLSAVAADPDGTIARVDYVQGSTVVATALQSPFQAAWEAVPAGTYTISAVATDNLGAQTTSASITITVLPSGWSRVATVGQEVAGIWFVDAAEGWVVGAGGTILHSVDGGVTWVPQSSGTSQDLFKIQFVDADRGWVVGAGGTVLRTTDGGATWTPSSTGTNSTLLALSFVDADTGWVVGQDPNVFVTGDGGVTWVALPTGAPGAVSHHAVRFADRSNGWVLTTVLAPLIQGGTDERDVILRTTDGGLTWTEQLRTEVHNGRFEALDLVGATTAWVSRTFGMRHSPDGIEHTADGGATWTRQSYQAAGIFALDFVSDTQGWGVGNFGTVIHTEDGGQSWTTQLIGGVSGVPTLLDVHFVDANTGWAVGSGGVILKTTTGGKAT